MFSLSFRQCSVRLLSPVSSSFLSPPSSSFSSSSSFSASSFSSSFVSVPVRSPLRSSPFLSDNVFMKKKFKSSSHANEEFSHPPFDFAENQEILKGTNFVNSANFDLHRKIHDLTERVEELTDENEQLKEKIRSYNPSKYATRPGSSYEPSSHLSWMTGLKRNGPLNLFYIHHPLTNEIPLNHKTNTHVDAWTTLTILTIIQGTILALWVGCALAFSDGVAELEHVKTKEENDEALKNVYAAVDDIVFMEENFMTSNTSVLKHGRYWTLLTACFSHSNVAHFVGNLVAMWLFGFKLLRVVGPYRFMFLYSVGGLFASICQNAFTTWEGGVEEMPSFRERCKPDFDESIIRNPKYEKPCLGSSGSVLAMAGAASLFFPRDMVIVRFVPFPIPFPLAAGLYFASDLVGITHPDFLYKITNWGRERGENEEYSPTVGHAAHVGGIVFGALFSLVLLWKRKKLPTLQQQTKK